jgi:hypothetical protein
MAVLPVYESGARRQVATRPRSPWPWGGVTAMLAAAAFLAGWRCRRGFARLTGSW